MTPAKGKGDKAKPPADAPQPAAGKGKRRVVTTEQLEAVAAPADSPNKQRCYVTREQAEQVVVPETATPPPAGRPAPSGSAPSWMTLPRDEVIRRAHAYLDKVEPAVSGQKGHNQTYKVAAILVIDFALSIDEARPLMQEFSARCVPPWSPAEIEHKLTSADKRSDPRGKKLEESCRKANGRHQHQANGHAAAGQTPGTAPASAAKRKLRTPAPFHPFPVDCLPSPLSLFVRQGTEALGCDPAYLALPAVAVAASAIGNSRTIRLKSGWQEPSIIWTVVIGDSGTLKSPAFRLAVSHQFQQQADLSRQYRAACDDHRDDVEAYKQKKRLKKGAKDDDLGEPPTAPVFRRIITTDTTVEKIVEVLEDNPRGMMVARNELAGWIGSFTRYKGSQGGTDVQAWLEMWDAGTVIVDRKTGDRRTTIVQRAAVSVTGGIQPGALARSLTPEMFDCGFTARLLLAMPPKRVKRWTEVEVAPEVLTAYHQLLERLLALEAETRNGEDVPVALNLTRPAKEAWVGFYNEWAGEQAAAAGEVAAAFSKLEAYAARFALLHHVVTCCGLETTDRREVGARSVEAGITLARWFGEEAARIYASLSETREDREVRELVEFLASQGGRVTARQLQRARHRKYTSAEHAEEALAQLVTEGLAAWEERPAEARGGRPTRDCVLLAPPPSGTGDKTDKTPAHGGGPQAEDETVAPATAVTEPPVNAAFPAVSEVLSVLSPPLEGGATGNTKAAPALPPGESTGGFVTGEEDAEVL
jgi:hypothetical protein